MKEIKTYCDLCGITIASGNKEKDCALLSIYPKTHDDEGKYHPEWHDVFEIDLCDDCYSRLRKDFMSKIVKKEGGDESI